ncbi:hypothetical protein [Nitrosococcus watsonii]|uniref:Uncharacterized protein n=1 Tax=Nitrosococcus watsoni (strain C-113) TaxID=105559 RepID=D8K6J3_NITWC|nr:hypothetical protein [Nitrosococcus watsonii]ADJ28520.1 conserved hypothetical protein [Nitrosococcus watsonii C-113]
MTTFIEHYRLFKVSGDKYCAMLIILLLIGSMATATLEAQEAPEGLAFLRSLGIY